MSNIETPRDAVDPDALGSDASTRGRVVADEVPEADALDQQADVSADDEERPASMDLPLEANPADVGDQLRSVPLDDDDDVR